MKAPTSGNEIRGQLWTTHGRSVGPTFVHTLPSTTVTAHDGARSVVASSGVPSVRCRGEIDSIEFRGHWHRASQTQGALLASPLSAQLSSLAAWASEGPHWQAEVGSADTAAQGNMQLPQLQCD